MTSNLLSVELLPYYKLRFAKRNRTTRSYTRPYFLGRFFILRRRSTRKVLLARSPNVTAHSGRFVSSTGNPIKARYLLLAKQQAQLCGMFLNVSQAVQL